ncbi:ATP binding protein, putative isoform 1 [Hibiscus syriacus]|uniref:ATP binding protein, putative isoform 1 n=1 Tax=Hibiscus syriacus TaxID=106335 RepID=A0A6A3BHM1_HIBSY|nr:ATP binding protein, putative isoform 1 [Hibiscus syriacus]
MPRYLVTFTVGYDQRKNIDAAVRKDAEMGMEFSGNFTILLFHYDGRATEWDEFEWSKQAIQNDLVRGWGLDFALRKCVEPAHEKIGVVDAQWIVHQSVPSLGNQGESQDGKAPWKGVRERCRKEWSIFQVRFSAAERAYFKSINSTSR